MMHDIPAPNNVAAPPADANKTDSGIAWILLKANPDGKTIHPSDWVKLHYTGWTVDGKMFDSSIPTGAPATFPLDHLIPGMNEAIQLGKTGESIRVWIPEEHAYKGVPGAPQGTLVFDFDIIDVTEQVSPPFVPTDEAVQLHDGLAYQIVQAGSADKPIDLNNVAVIDFSAWHADSQNRFHSTLENGEPLTAPVKSLFPGLRDVLVHAHEGDSLIAWIPQKLGIDPTGRDLPGSLVFEIQVLQVQEAPKTIAAPDDVAAPPADAVKTASGLYFKVLTPGTGTKHPGKASRVRVHYTGWTVDGAMFDSSVVRGQAIEFNLNQVIPGWTEGVQLMVEGEKRRLWIPENLAYRGQPGAPAGMLVFDVELISF